MTTYQTDFYQWTVQQADALRHEDYADLDIANLIEELENMGRSDRRELKSRLTTIIEHMLKLICEPNSRAVRGWRQTIQTQRIDLKDLLSDNATLRSQVDDFITLAYDDARFLAANETKCQISDFPAHCQWTGEQILDLNWLP